MPKGIKKRGRRAEKKRKEEHEAGEFEQNANFVPVTGQTEEEAEAAYYGDGETAAPKFDDSQFYGLLTDEEAEYFRGADEVLESNSFNDADERGLFIANVYREADGKELKIASSQGCSRLLEKLVLLSTPAQLKKLWKAFTGHFLNLVQHRFASHCCEVLFERSVVVASREMDPAYVANGGEMEGDEVFAGMESLFLYMLNEIEPSIIPLLSHTFASHPLRALLLILSGQPVSSSASQSLVQSRKKKNISVVSDFAPPEARETGAAIEVPASFTEAMERIVATVGAGLDVENIRAMAVHPIGSPTLQVLLQLEMRKSRNERKKSGEEEATLLGKLTGISEEEEEDEEGEEEGDRRPSSFFSNLLYDPVGSHLAEKIMSYAPKKEFKKLYKAHFRTRMGSLARNETAGFVVVRVLEKLGKDTMKEAIGEILKEIGGMIGEFEPSFVHKWMGRYIQIFCIITILFRNLELRYFVQTIGNLRRLQLHLRATHLQDALEEGKEPPRPKRDPKQRHGSLLAQSMLQLPGSFHNLIASSLVAQSSATLVALSQHPQGSHVVQAFLLSPHSSTPDKRKLLNQLRGAWVQLATHQSGSHIADAAWPATSGLMNYKQAITVEFLAAEAEMRESFFGRNVWRNWAMDKYKTRRNEWFGLAKEAASLSLASEVGALKLSSSGGPGAATAQGPQQQQGERKKTAIELLALIQPYLYGFISTGDSGAGPGKLITEPLPPHELTAVFDLDLPAAEGRGEEGLLAVVKKVLRYSVNTWSPGFMDKLYASTDPVGVVSELVLAVLNTNVHVYQVSPALTIIEKATTARLANLMGFNSPNAGGMTLPGGSASNSTSMVIARNSLFPDTQTKGNGAYRFVVFTSAHGHYSVEKAAILCGFGSEAVWTVPVDKQGRMIVSDLEALVIKAKEEGFTPFYVNAGAGTTVLGSFDPFEEIGDVCRRHGLWFHVDGSWGGSVAFSENQKWRLKGVERADSMTMNPHKMLGVPMTCSFLLTNDRRRFWGATMARAGYLFHETEEDGEDEIYDLAQMTMGCGRRGDSLKMAFGWIYYGKDGYQGTILFPFHPVSSYCLLSSSAAFCLYYGVKKTYFHLVSENPPPCLQV
ncbi:glutamate decarboxylase 1 [Morchella snyderi]|nr:glutamate decarboxylase 1 [Morchella snyderi]